ncbi:MAG: tail fiber domain-containing protein [Bacteroidia bacterium]|nr:tail fiber domain-containing protein [Bacteroidia bacterium]
MRNVKFIIALFTLVLVFGFGWSQSGAPQAFNYQGVVRDLNGQPMKNKNITLWLSIHQGAQTGPRRYWEYHQTQTNDFGLYNIKVGLGDSLSGNFKTIQWGTDKFFIKVEIDPNGGGNNQSADVAGFAELLSVPYALYSGGTGGTIDRDSTNEIQHISKNSNTKVVTLDLGGGTFVDEVNDDDSDPSNELQVLTQFGASVQLSNGGGTISINDGDFDATNEIQTISKNNGVVTLTSGGSFTLGDDNSTNEIQSLSLVGDQLTISSGNTVTVDPSATNELQTLSQNGDTISISGGNSVVVNDGDWMDDTYGLNCGNKNIGIGQASNTSYKVYIENDNSTTNARYGLRLTQSNYLSSTIYGAYFSNNNYYTGSASSNYGAYNYSYRSGGDGGYCYGSYNYGSNYGTAYGTAYGIFTSSSRGSSGYGPSYGGYISGNNYGGDGDAYGAYIYSYKTSGAMSYNAAYGAYAYSYSYSTNTGENYGLYAYMSTGSGTRYAGYFEGSVYSTGSYLPSDERLKKNIRPYQSALPILAKLQVYNYDYKTEDFPRMNLPEGEQVGLLADELESAMPSLVKKAVSPTHTLTAVAAVNELVDQPHEVVMQEVEDESGVKVNKEMISINGTIMTPEEALSQFAKEPLKMTPDGQVVVGERVEFKSVNYAGLVPVLVQSIKEQQEMIQKLEQRISDLEKQVNK